MPISILTIIILVMSAILHEYAHGWVAYKLGDNTARDAGRLTLNPVAHIDLFGSILMPLLLIMSGTGFILGWAKPVPYNPYNLSDAKFGDAKVALGGPLTNLMLAIFFGTLSKALPIYIGIKQNLIIAYFSGNYELLLSSMNGSLVTSIFVISIIACFINLLLMIFNLVPVPPLDGSKVLMTFLPPNWQTRMHQIEPYGTFIILFLLMSGFFTFIWPIIIFLFELIVGF